MGEHDLTWTSGVYDVRVERGRGLNGEEVISEIDVRHPSGRHWWGNVATVEQIEERLRHYAWSGEGAGGAYFWCTGMIVVRDTSEDTLRAAVDDLISTGEFATALELLPDG